MSLPHSLILLSFCFPFRAGYVACVGQLLDHTPMLLNDDDGDGMTPLLTSCFFGRHDLVRQLLKMGADITNV